MKRLDFIKATQAKLAENDMKMSREKLMAVMNAFSDAILDVIAAEDSVKFGDVCTFSGVTKAAHEGRNPATGAKVKVPTKHGRPKCKFSSTAKA